MSKKFVVVPVEPTKEMLLTLQRGSRSGGRRRMRSGIGGCVMFAMPLGGHSHFAKDTAPLKRTKKLTPPSSRQGGGV